MASRLAAMLAIAGMLVALPAGQCLASDGTAAAPPVRATIELKISPDEMSELIRLRLPLGGSIEQEIEQLRATRARFADPYRKSLEKILIAGRLVDKEDAERIAGSMHDLPELRISNGEATLTTLTHQAVLWSIDGDGRSVELPTIQVPPATELKVAMDVVGDRVESATPLPRMDDGEGHLSWTFRDGESPGISVGLHDAVAQSGVGFEPEKAALAFLAIGLPFAILLLLLLLSRRSIEELLAGYRALAVLAYAGVALSAFCAAFLLHEAQEVISSGPGVSIVVRGSLYTLNAMLISLVGIVGFVALAKGRRAVLGGVATALSLVFAAVVSRWDYLNYGIASLWLDKADVYRDLACLAGALLIVLVFDATVRWLAYIWPEAARRWRKAIPRPLRLGAFWATVAGAAGQLALATHAGIGFTAQFDPPVSTWSIRLLDFFKYLPLQLANLSLVLSLTLFGLALAIWLWHRAGNGEIDLSDPWDCTALGLFAATTITGVWGELDGYPAPLAFFFTLIATAVAIGVLARSERGRLALDTQAQGSAKRLLAAATELRSLRRRRAALIAAVPSDRTEEEAHEERIERIDAKRGQLLDAELGSVGRDDRGREMLTLGLAAGRGARDRLRTLARRGGWVLIVPVGYSLFVQLHNNAAGAVSAQQPFGLAFLGTSLVSQALMWPIAVWFFVLVEPIAPGRIGPLKGLVVGIFTTVPPVLASAFLDDPLGPRQWLFLSAGLTLLFMIAGLVLDYRSVRESEGDLRQLSELYSVTNFRSGLVYASVLTVLFLSVAQGLANGSGAQALEEAATHAASLPPIP